MNLRKDHYYIFFFSRKRIKKQNVDTINKMPTALYIIILQIESVVVVDSIKINLGVVDLPGFNI